VVPPFWVAKPVALPTCADAADIGAARAATTVAAASVDTSRRVIDRLTVFPS
jgi:hypothetical protein